MWKTKSRNHCLRISPIAVMAFAAACATGAKQDCAVPDADRIIGVWETLTPSSLGPLNPGNMTAFTEHTRNRNGLATTNVHWGSPQGPDCRCCLTLVFAERPAGNTLISALVARRFPTASEALTFAGEAWQSFSGSAASVEEEFFLQMEHPSVRRSATSSRGGRAFIGDLGIERESPSQFIVRLHFAEVDGTE